MSSCITELLSQGNPVKIDGLGTFVPTVESTKDENKETKVSGFAAINGTQDLKFRM